MNQNAPPLREAKFLDHCHVDTVVNGYRGLDVHKGVQSKSENDETTRFNASTYFFVTSFDTRVKSLIDNCIRIFIEITLMYSTN